MRVMCGIAGLIGYPLSESKELLGTLLDRLKHRGPDGEGRFEEPGAILGHRRLSIIDIQGGSQPMISADGNFVITYNGEVYNYVELREELIARGVKLRTHSDTEVVLELYSLDSEKMLERLNGMFAFAIWDRRKKSLFAARDHFGIKPFYYTISGDRLVFASELKALSGLPGFNPEIDPDSLRHYLTFQFYLGEETMLQGIKRLEPATCLRFESGKLRLEKYWHPEFNTDFDHDEKYFRDRLLSAMEDAVAMNLRSDVPVSAYLSGGMDSSAVSTMASRLSGNKVHCFCGRFENPGYDELPFAREVASSIGMPLSEITIGPDDFINCIEKVIYALDEPVAGPGSFPQFIVSRTVSEKFKVVLGGQGGDEFFAGYIRYLVAYLEQAIKGAVMETQEEGNHIVTLHSIVSNLPQLRNYLPMMQHFWSSGMFQPMELRYFHLIRRDAGMHEVIHDDFRPLLNHPATETDFAEFFGIPSTPSYLNRMMSFDVRTLLPSLLQVEDRVGMAHSLESRVPLLDRRIIELMNSVPPAVKFCGGKTKHLMREAVKSILPLSIVERKDKAGFPVPLGEWLKIKKVTDFLSDLLLSEKARTRGIHRPDSVQNMLKTEGQFDRRLWAFLSLEIWQRHFIDR